MKYFLLLFALGYGFLNAQTAPKKVPVISDTLRPGQMVCIDGNVVQFNVTVVQNGIIAKTATIQGSCYLESFASRPGNTIYCDEIIVSPSPGMYVRLPPRKYFIEQRRN